MKRVFVPTEYKIIYLKYCEICLKNKKKKPTIKEFGDRVVKILRKYETNLMYDETIKF